MSNDKEIAARVDELKRLRAQCIDHSILVEMIDASIAELDPPPELTIGMTVVRMSIHGKEVVRPRAGVVTANQGECCVVKFASDSFVHPDGVSVPTNELKPAPFDLYDLGTSMLAGHLLSTDGLPELDTGWEYAELAVESFYDEGCCPTDLTDGGTRDSIPIKATLVARKKSSPAT